MTDTAAEPTMLDAERSASARLFFELAAPTFEPLPPPTVTMPAAAAPATPQLPRIIPATPSAGSAAAAASPFAFSAASMMPSPSGAQRKQQAKGGGTRRFVSRVVMLAILGGIVFAGVKYGPELMDRAQGDSTNSEPEAPLAFPAVTPGQAPVRTADLVVERPTQDGSTIRYEVTNDFETGVSRMLIDRATMPDIEVLAVFDQANLHLVDQPHWWSTPRGEFPFIGGPERERWVRTIDDYLPADLRPFVTIDESTESVLGTETMRHLVVSIDSVAVATNRAANTVDPATGLEVPPAAAAPGEFVPPSVVASTPEAVAPVRVELWVDANGIIRKLIEPAELGGGTLTVVSVSDEAFNPTFPAAEAVVPLTASYLVDFAL